MEDIQIIILLLILLGSILFYIRIDYLRFQRELGGEGFNIAKIMRMISCPFKILENLPLCSLYYLEDLVMYAIWGVLYLIFFIFGYLPISLTFSISCLFGKEVCFLLKPNDICPTKDFVSSVIEYLYQIFSGGRRFLYRNRSDVKKCYCMSPIKLMFNPLTKFTPLNEIMGASSAMNGGVVLGMLILGIIYYMNGSKSQSTNK